MEEDRHWAVAAATAVVASVAAARQCLPVGWHQANTYDSLPILRTRFGTASVALPQRASRGDVDSINTPLVWLRRNIRPRSTIK